MIITNYIRGTVLLGYYKALLNVGCVTIVYHVAGRITHVGFTVAEEGFSSPT